MSTPDYITPNQLANMIEKRGRELQAIRERLQKFADPGSRCARAHLDAVIDHLCDAAGDLRGAICEPAAVKAMHEHQPGLPPGGGQPDLFT